MQFVVQSGAEPGKTYDLNVGTELSVGRQSANQIVVSDEQVSRRHAEIKGIAGGALVTDLGSSNGTFVNGTRVSSPQTIRPGDTLQVGTTVLRLVDSDNVVSTMPAGYDQPAPLNNNNYNAGFDNNSAAQAAPINNYANNNMAGYQQPSENTYNPNPNGNYGQAGSASTQAANNYNPNAYQQQPPPPNAYINASYNQGQAATPAKTGTGLPMPILIGVAVVVALLIIGGILLVVLGGGGGGGGADLPAPPKSSKVNLTLDDLKKLSPGEVPSDTSGVTLASYDSEDNTDSILKFYRDDFNKKGWASKEDTVTSLAYTKGDQAGAVAVIPLPNQETITGLETVLPALKGQLKVGHTLVITIKGPTNKINITPGAQLMGKAA
jgi:hypothetical protein